MRKTLIVFLLSTLSLSAAAEEAQPAEQETATKPPVINTEELTKTIAMQSPYTCWRWARKNIENLSEVPEDMVAKLLECAHKGAPNSTGQITMEALCVGVHLFEVHPKPKYNTIVERCPLEPAELKNMLIETLAKKAQEAEE